MSVMDKLINAMKFNDDSYDDENENEDGDYFESEPEPGPEADYQKEETSMGENDSNPAPRTVRRRVMPERDASPSPNPAIKRQLSESGMEVYIAKPTTLEDARDVTDMILAGSTVVLNLEGLEVEIAQRIIDFTTGSCYAVHGNVMKISHFIFVITPSTVDINGDISTPAGADKDGATPLDMPFLGR